MTASRSFFDAIGCLIYAVAFSDKEIEKEELKNIGKIILSQFGLDMNETRGMRAIAKFESLADNSVSSQDAYDESIKLLELNMEDLKMHRGKIIEVLQRVSMSDNTLEESERAWIHKFQMQTEQILGHSFPTS